MTITKKWKCASVEPPVKWTRTAEEVSRPIDTMQARNRRLRRCRPAAAAKVAIGSVSTPMCHIG